MKESTSVICCTLAAVGCLAADPTFTVDATGPLAKVSPMLYGLMTEEINHSYDGGLYAELIRNRAFLDDKTTAAHWSLVKENGAEASMTLDPTNGFNDQLTAGARQWRPDLIGYEALSSYGSPSYYAIQMFSRNLGDEILPVRTAETSIQGAATRDSRTGGIFIKLVNPSPDSQPLHLSLKGTASLFAKASVITLAGNPEDTNSIEDPKKAVPITSTVNDVQPDFVSRCRPTALWS